MALAIIQKYAGDTKRETLWSQRSHIGDVRIGGRKNIVGAGSGDKRL